MLSQIFQNKLNADTLVIGNCSPTISYCTEKNLVVWIASWIILPSCMNNYYVIKHFLLDSVINQALHYIKHIYVYIHMGCSVCFADGCHRHQEPSLIHPKNSLLLLRPRVLVTDQKLSDAYDILTLLEAGFVEGMFGLGIPSLKEPSHEIAL